MGQNDPFDRSNVKEWFTKKFKNLQIYLNVHIASNSQDKDFKRL